MVALCSFSSLGILCENRLGDHRSCAYNGNNYNDDDDDDNEKYDDDNDRDMGNNDNVHRNANKGGRQFVASCLSGRDYCG